ncbi:MAG: DUF2183 domain-containing protein [Gammaproteobacteria bacterium]|nr:DUF2183 domain-containing protein [Gammaproteobacteria bacterium]
MTRFLLLCIAASLVACDSRTATTGDVQTSYSNIAADETVVFFRTAAWLDEAQQMWHVPVHGWIYEPQDSAARKAFFTAVLESEFNLVPDDETEDNYTSRLNLLIADSERGKQIVVNLAGRSHVLPPSAENGHFETTLVIPVVDIEKHAQDAVLTLSAVTRPEESRSFYGEALLIQPTGMSIISDIDDTVKISNVTDKRSLLEHTFLLDFNAAPGMVDLYDEWQLDGLSLHFVSSSPWQLYSPLVEFLDASGFSPSALNLKSVRFRDETLLDLFKKGTETKPAVIEKILNTYPDRRFVLVGDSGEQDPEVYAELITRYPEQVLEIYIRNVTGESADNGRFASVFRNVEKSRWQLFDHPRELRLP